MIRLLLSISLLLPAFLMAQDTTSCATQEGLEYDLDDDMTVGVGDILEVLSWFGANFDLDQDGILDCEDECVGAYDECGVCNGPGPQVLVIDTIITTYDSVYVDAIDDWLTYELGTDTLFTLVCEESNVFISCGDDVQMDGYSYSTVLIGDQCWFAENLRTTTYADGTLIPAGLTDGEWTSTTFGATAVYGEGNSVCNSYSPDINACDEDQSFAAYGRLYNWYAVDDARGLCPNGWHVPTDPEWSILKSYVASQGFAGSEGTALKSTASWAGGGNGTDDFGFSALPGGARNASTGGYGPAGNRGYWWSSSLNGDKVWFRDLNHASSAFFRYDSYPSVGRSVRCLWGAAEPGTQGCTDPAYLEYDPAANSDDGSCSTLASTCSAVQMDGHTYSVVEIGDQCWFAENLRTTTYADGTLIPAGLTDGEWTSTTSGATAVYGESSSSCESGSPDIDACDEVQSLAEYGRLYNWYAVDDVRGLCPAGWHVPTDGEWTELGDYITSQGFVGTEGTALKSTTGWCCNGNGVDQVGFTAKSGGFRWNPGNFGMAGYFGRWWASSLNDYLPWSRTLSPGAELERWAYDARDGFSVRCLRDADEPGTQGCTDPAYLEYDFAANSDDGSCSTPVIEGCTDENYTEYDPAANTDDGSCATLVVEGCTDENYTEYDPAANSEDGSCSTLASTCSAVQMDGHTYSVVEIGDQCWFAENLRTTTYADGTLIPAGLTDGEWTSTTSGATAVYGESSSSCESGSPDIDACDEVQSLAEYGRLYNWYAVDDVRGLCPAGWHVPTDGEWTELGDYITSQGFVGTEGTALKSTTGWCCNGNGVDQVGFTAKSGGFRWNPGNFGMAGYFGRWWASSLNDYLPWSRTLSPGAELERWAYDARDGFSVRCLRDAE